MPRFRFPRGVAAATLMAFAVAAQAHNLILTAAPQGEVVAGKAQFPDGAPAAEADIQIRDADSGAVLFTGTTAEDGTFEAPLPEASEYTIVCTAADGHRESITLRDGAAAATHEHEHADEHDHDHADDHEHAHEHGDASHGAGVDSHDLEHLIEDAVSAQVGPLRQDLQAMQQQTGLRDIVGGVGYILGLAGAIVLVRSRMQSRG